YLNTNKRASQLNKKFGRWVEAERNLPGVEGDYMCRVRNGEREFEAVRRLVHDVWFGGCRPFSDNDVVVEWYEHPVLNVFQQQQKTHSTTDLYFDFACRITIAIEHLTQQEADIETVLRVLTDQTAFIELLAEHPSKEAAEVVEHYMSYDNDHYRIVLAGPIAALKKARSCMEVAH
ncbi:hypothetical protein QTO17_06505, partial [Vibrio owensii]